MSRSGIAHANIGIGTVAAAAALTPPLIYSQPNQPASAGGTAGGQFMGTAIKAPFGGTNIQWSVEAKKIGTPTGSMTARLYECSTGSYVPNTSLGNAAESYDIATQISTSYTGTLIHTFNWSGLTIVSGTNYAVAWINNGVVASNGGFLHDGRELQSVNGIVDAHQVFWSGSSWSVLTAWETTGTIELWTV